MMQQNERQQISFGKLITRENYITSPFIPGQIRSHLADTPYYLYIFVPADEIIKVSIFACKSGNIKKILIRLKEFAPELVKGISTVLKNFKLSEGTIHTTGLCFESTRCFYETYVDATVMKEKNLSLDKIREEFSKVNRVEEVIIKDITISE